MDVHFRYILVGLLLIVMTAMLLRRGRRMDNSKRWRRGGLWVIAGSCAFAGGPMLGVGMWMTACFYGPRPAPVAMQLFAGVRYERVIRDAPRPQVIHIIEVEAMAPGVDFIVTPAELTPGERYGHRMPARTTTEFLEEFDAQVAVNAAFFVPFTDRNPLWTYPWRGQTVHALGVWASDGVLYNRRAMVDQSATLIRGMDGRWRPGPIGDDGMYDEVVSGQHLLVQRGSLHSGGASYTAPRTAMGISADGRRVWLVVVDGRQPTWSEGATLNEVAELLIDLGADHAVELDGGGSTTLAIESAGGDAELLNRPIHSRIPYRQRPVANHIGVRARREPGP